MSKVKVTETKRLYRMSVTRMLLYICTSFEIENMHKRNVGCCHGYLQCLHSVTGWSSLTAV